MKNTSVTQLEQVIAKQEAMIADLSRLTRDLSKQNLSLTTQVCDYQLQRVGIKKQDLQKKIIYGVVQFTPNYN